jgi:hypothetical protein
MPRLFSVANMSIEEHETSHSMTRRRCRLPFEDGCWRALFVSRKSSPMLDLASGSVMSGQYPSGMIKWLDSSPYRLIGSFVAQSTHHRFRQISARYNTSRGGLCVPSMFRHLVFSFHELLSELRGGCTWAWSCWDRVRKDSSRRDIALA